MSPNRKAAPPMSRAHFEFIAVSMAKASFEVGIDDMTFDAYSNVLATLLQETNPLFKPETFVKAAMAAYGQALSDERNGK